MAGFRTREEMIRFSLELPDMTIRKLRVSPQAQKKQRIFDSLFNVKHLKDLITLIYFFDDSESLIKYGKIEYIIEEKRK